MRTVANTKGYFVVFKLIYISLAVKIRLMMALVTKQMVQADIYIPER